MANPVINGTINIDWFGDRKAYEQSNIKIITVGLNPSGIEFGVDKKNKISDVNLRFKGITSPILTHPIKGDFANVWNNYFKENPYKWFSQGFEHVLRGIDASYGGKLLQNGKQVSYTAIHTDLCTPWATDPTWSKLPKSDQQALIAPNDNDFEEWITLVEELKPDIIVFSVRREYWSKLENLIDVKDWINLKNTFGGGHRNCWYRKGIYKLSDKNAVAILGITTQRGPFGDLNDGEKETLGTYM